MKLFTIIEKNYKIFIRSKVSALIIFLGPLLLVSLIGLSFSNSQLPGLTVGTFAPAYNEFTDSILSKVMENKFTIQKYDSQDSCSDAVKRGDAGICLIFPKDMSRENNEVTFIVDYSKLNLVWIVVDIFNNKVSERATELRTNYANDLLNRVVQTKSDLSSQKNTLVTLTTKQLEGKDILFSAKSGLNDINPTTNIFSDVDAGDAKASINAVAIRIDDAQDSIGDAKIAVTGSSLSATEKTVLTDKLNAIDSDLNNAETYLEGNGSIHSLEYIMNALDNALQSAIGQLENIKKQKAEVSGELITLETSIADAQSSVNSISKSVDIMLERINAVQSSDAEYLVSPIKTRIEPVTTQETHFNYLFPTLIVLIIMITAVLLSSTFVMNEKKSRSAFRNFITPTSDLVFNAGTFLTSLSAILMQLVIFLFISSLFFSTDLGVSILSTILVLLTITTTFILLGMVVGYLFKSEETYVLASITVSALLLFLSSTIMPIESISDSVREFASITPFVVSETLLRQVMFFNFSLGTMWYELLILLGYSLVFIATIFVIQKLFRFTISFKRKESKKESK